MAFLERIKSAVTGKSQAERDADRVADQIAQRKINAMVRKEREAQNIRIAQERIRAKADAQIQRIRNPPRPAPYTGFSSSVGSFFTAPSPVQSQVQYKRVRVSSRSPKMKRRKIKYKRVMVKPNIQTPRRFDVIRGGGSSII